MRLASDPRSRRLAFPAAPRAPRCLSLSARGKKARAGLVCASSLSAFPVRRFPHRGAPEPLRWGRRIRSVGRVPLGAVSAAPPALFCHAGPPVVLLRVRAARRSVCAAMPPGDPGAPLAARRITARFRSRFVHLRRRPHGVGTECSRAQARSGFSARCARICPPHAPALGAISPAKLPACPRVRPRCAPPESGAPGVGGLCAYRPPGYVVVHYS